MALTAQIAGVVLAKVMALPDDPPVAESAKPALGAYMIGVAGLNPEII